MSADSLGVSRSIAQPVLVLYGLHFGRQRVGTIFFIPFRRQGLGPLPLEKPADFPPLSHLSQPHPKGQVVRRGERLEASSTQAEL